MEAIKYVVNTVSKPKVRLTSLMAASDDVKSIGIPIIYFASGGCSQLNWFGGVPEMYFRAAST